MKRLIHVWKGSVVVWLLLVTPVAILESITPLQWTDLRFQHEQIMAGQWWRIFTGHLDHLGWAHLSLNALFLGFCLVLFSPLKHAKSTLCLWLAACFLISMCMLFLPPTMSWYVGLSGSLYSLLIIGVLLEARYSIALRLMITGIVFLKVWFEQEAGQTWVSNFIAGPVAERSHLYGVCAGIGLAMVVVLWRRLSNDQAIGVGESDEKLDR